MALDNYTRRQKIMITALIVVIAAMFTVTGSLTYMLGESQKTPTRAGEMDGKAYNYVEFHQRIRQGLNSCMYLDYSQGQGEEKPRAMYPRVPCMTTMPQDAAETPYERSLLEVWPHYKDNYVWCHLALVKRAEKAGFVRPSNQAVWDEVASLMNASRGEFEKFKLNDLYKEFHDRFGYELNTIEPTLRECLLVRSYVDSLVAAERARLAEIALIAAGNHTEVKAEYLRLPVAPFVAKARAEVEREHANNRAAGAAYGAAVSSASAGSDPFSEMYAELLRQNHLDEEARFEFEIIKAEFRDAEQYVPSDGKMERVYYEAMKKAGEFKATEEDKKNIDARVNEEMNKLDAARRAEGKPGFTPEEDKKTREEIKPKMLEHKSFYEVRGDLFVALRRDKAPLVAQALILRLKAELDDIKKKKEKTLNATSALNDQKQRNVDSLRNQRSELRGRFDSVASLINSQCAQIVARLPVAPNAGASEADKKSYEIRFSNVIEDLVRFLDDDLGREQMNTLTSTAQRLVQDLDRTLRDKEARLEEQKNQKEMKDPAGEAMEPEQRELELQRLQLEIDGLKDQIALRDLLLEGKGGKKEDSARAFADKFKKLLVGYKLSLRGLLNGDIDTRRFALEELLAETPVALGRELRNARDRVVPQQAIDELETQSQLMRADADAFRSRMKREAADTRTINLEKIIGDANTDAKAPVLKLSAPFGRVRLLTWRDVVTDNDLRFLEYVDGAKRFLEEPNFEEGAVSEIMGLPDKGLYMLRLLRKTPRFQQGKSEVYERVMDLAARRRARQLCIAELKRIRDEIVKHGWDEAIGDAKKRNPALEVKKTDWIASGIDIAEIQSEGDSELLAFSSAPSVMDPDKPFIDRLKEIKPEDEVSEIIPEKFNKDLLKKPEEEQWNYMLARIIDRRNTSRRLETSDIEDSPYGRGAADIAAERRLAASALIMELVTPARLLAEHEILRYPSPRELEDEKDNSEGQ